MPKKTMEEIATGPLKKSTSKAKAESSPPKKAGNKELSAKPAKSKNKEPAKPAKKGKKEKKIKLSFALSQSECLILAELREKCRQEGMPYKKNDFVRAGLACLSTMSMTGLLKALAKNTKPVPTEKPKGKN
jgi:hypothetical protein